ncbi:SHOCT domain-containing protein [Nostoc sp.]|uniref:SHOCT domain-containing protein n=1 Tax=Nostoc sp. TaxID=1180 RepID=UPI002FF9CA09
MTWFLLAESFVFLFSPANLFSLTNPYTILLLITLAGSLLANFLSPETKAFRAEQKLQSKDFKHPNSNTKTIISSWISEPVPSLEKFKVLLAQVVTKSKSKSEPISDPVMKLEQLKKMQEQGIITESEFETKKREILDKM